MLSAQDYLPTNCWLMKTEPDVFSLDDLVKRGREPWDGVRNYQARNFMRDHMKVGHQVLIYHSNVAEPGVVGLAEVLREAIPDPSALDPKSPYFDPKSLECGTSRWVMVTVGRARFFPRLVSLAELKAHPVTSSMLVARAGQRLSVQPVSKIEFESVLDQSGFAKQGAKL